MRTSGSLALCLTLGVAVLLLMASPPAEAVKITSSSPSYGILRLVQTRQATLHELSESCQQAEEISRIVHAVSALASPLVPTLDSLAESKALAAIARLPFVGKPAAALQNTAAALRELLKVLVWADRIDSEYEAPIREAILKSDRLLTSQDEDDVRPLLKSYEAACVAATKMQANLATARGKVDRCIALVGQTMQVLEKLGAPAGGTETSCNELLKQLYLLRSATDAMTRQVGDGQHFMQQVLAAGGYPVASGGGVSAGRNGDASVEPNSSSAVRALTRPSEAAGASGGALQPPAPGASPGHRAVLPLLGRETPNLESAPLPQPGPAQDASHQPGPGSGGTWLLVLASLPGIGALVAIGWMLVKHYGSSARISAAMPVVSQSGVEAPEALATLRIGARQVLIPADQSAVLGRDAGPGSIELDDASISARHAVIECRQGAWWLTDAGSSNGTYVNGKRIHETALHDGDRLQLGEVGAIFSSVRK